MSGVSVSQDETLAVINTHSQRVVEEFLVGKVPGTS